MWLRDHGEDPTSFNPNTRQRRVDVLSRSVPVGLSAEFGPVTDQAGQHLNALQISWDDGTATWISTATLDQLLTSPDAPNGPPLHLWSDASTIDPPIAGVADILETEAAVDQLVATLYTFGFAQLSGFSGGHAEVDALARRIGYPRSTIFDPIWTLAPDLNEHEDTAYSDIFLGPHTDGTYSHDAPGLQMFCCVERSGSGGESIVVDGFAAAEDLRSSRPDLFDVLTTVDVPAHYVEPGVELRASRPAIRLSPTGTVQQISFNNYDRSPMLLGDAAMTKFYEAYGEFHRLLNQPHRWRTVRLEPGDVLITDNWRGLHGRMAYTGRRVFHGCYLNHEDFESRHRLAQATTAGR